MTGPSSYPCYQTSSWHQLKKEKRKNSHGNHMISEFYFLLFKNTKIMSSSIQLQFHTTLPHSFKKLKKKKRCAIRKLLLFELTVITFKGVDHCDIWTLSQDEESMHASHANAVCDKTRGNEKSWSQPGRSTFTTIDLYLLTCSRNLYARKILVFTVKSFVCCSNYNGK